jgi:membrane protein DedA with SNARE-associated domain
MIFASISNWIIHIISALGLTGVAFLMAIESAAIPLPSEIIMPFSGFLVAAGRFSLLGISIAGAIGSVIGSLVLYYIGYFGGRPFIEKYGKYFLFHHDDLAKADRFFQKHGVFSNCIARILPVLRTYISLPAGIFKAEIKKFVLYSFIGSFIWSAFLGFIGIKLGQHWDSLRPYFHEVDLLLTILILAGIAWFVYKHLKRFRK